MKIANSDGVIIELGPQEQSEMLSTFPRFVPAISDYTSAINALIDGTAQSRRYDSGLSLSTYVQSANLEWATEAKVFVEWRDAVWLYCYAELAKVQACERPQPDVSDFLAELPEINWPSAA